MIRFFDTVVKSSRAKKGKNIENIFNDDNEDNDLLLATVCQAIDFFSQLPKLEGGKGFATDITLHQIILRDGFISRKSNGLENCVERALILKNLWQSNQTCFVYKCLAASKTKVLTNDLDRSLYENKKTSGMGMEEFNFSGQIETLGPILDFGFKDSNFQFISLQMIGSAASTLSLTGSSDLNLVLIVNGSEDMRNNFPASLVDRKATEIKVLAITKNKIDESNEYSVREVVTEARVPVLKLTCGSLDIDISVNQIHGILNTALLRRYTEMDSRVRQLILAVKYWAKRRGVSNPRNSTLTSYAWTILTIHFLQNVSPPVIPVLTLTPYVEEIILNNRNKVFPEFTGKFPSHEDIAEPIDWKSANTLSVGELLVKFFTYFGNFDSTVAEECGQKLFDMFYHICSIRQAGVHLKQLKTLNVDIVAPNDDENDVTGKLDSTLCHPVVANNVGIPLSEVDSPIWRICIEDPIDRHIDLGRVLYRFEGMQFIMEEIHRAQLLFVDTSQKNQFEECLFDRMCAINSDIPYIPSQCNHCGAEGHQSFACPEQLCSNCNGYGHHVSKCIVRFVCDNCGGAHRVSECPEKVNNKPPSQKSWSAVAAAPAKDNYSVKENRSPGGVRFVGEVLSWRVHQFTNDSLLRDRLRRLPMVFESSKTWYRAFYPLVLEECRAQLHQIADKDFFGVQVYPLKIYPAAAVQGGTRRRLYVVFPRELDREKLVSTAILSFALLVKKSSADSLSMARLKTLDHCLISISFPIYNPGDINERNLSPLELSLVSANPDCVIFGGEVLTISGVEEEFSSLKDQEPLSGWDVALLAVGSITFTRVCDALRSEAAPDMLMPDIIGGSSLSCAPTQSSIGEQQLSRARELSLLYCKNLDDFQRKSVWKVLQVAVDSEAFSCGLRDSAPSRLQIIKGPPGTGKTSTLVALMRSLIECGLRVHASAATNAAVCELARRVILTTEILAKREFTVTNSIDGADDDSGMKLRLGSFLLVGDARRLNIQDDPANVLHDILLEDRVSRIKLTISSISMNINNFLAMMRRRKIAANDNDFGAPSPPQPQKESVERNEVEIPVGNSLKNSLETLCFQFSIMIDEAPLNMITGLRTHAHKEHLLFLLSSACGFSDEVIQLWYHSNPTKLSEQQQHLFVQQQKQISSGGAGSDVKSGKLNRTLTIYKDAVALEDIMTQLSSLISQVKIYIYLPSEEDLIKQASIVFSTVNVSGKTIFNNVNFDVAVVDEATQLVQAEIAIVLRKSLCCLVLAGDDKQLPATVKSKNCCDMGYGMSCFSRLLELGYPFSLLGIQYRMHPEISRWPRVEFYEGLIEDGDNVRSEAYCKAWHDVLPPYSVFDVGVGQEEKDSVGSKYNEAEAMLVRKLVGQIKRYKGTISVGIISPYLAQVERLKHLEIHSTPYGELDDVGNESKTSVSIRVNTVDSFQGQECDIIIFTAVRSNNYSRIGFLNDERRLNVAATRARYSFVLICSASTVSSGNRTWEKLIVDAHQRCAFHSSATDKLIADTTRKIQNEEKRFKSFENNSNSELFEKALWKMVFTCDFRNSVSNGMSELVQSQLWKALIRLADGKWPNHMIQSNLVSKQYRNIIHVYGVLEFSVVWSVDVNQDNGEQYICLLDFVKEKKELSIAISRAEAKLKMYSEGYINRCAEKNYKKKVVCPKAWEVHDNDGFIWEFTKDNDKYSNNESKADTLQETIKGKDAVIHNKFFDLTTNVVKLFTFSIADFRNIKLPFTMSREQKKIVFDPKSLFILGRSGTGKTTIMLQRMFLQDIDWRKNVDESLSTNEKFPRQMLVTASSILCEAIKKSYHDMQEDNKKLEECSQSTRSSNERKQSELLNVSHHQLCCTAAEKDRLGPKSFTDCSDGYYPLIITYSKFLLMLDGTLESNSFFSKFKLKSLNIIEVDFNRFKKRYFPHFDRSKRVGDASLLFTEIMTFIKGSLGSLQTTNGYISKEEYLQLTKNRDSTLSHPERINIYECFVKYEKMKAETYLGDYDLLDVVTHVYQSLTKNPHLFSSQYLLNNVYVDEVQDLVPAQIVLFKFVCKNPNGFVFAGDTAQTIAHGVGFRFNNMKDLFYHEIVGKGIVNCSNSTAADLSKLMPSDWKLTENFRTHCGVVKLANSVVELILHFFPASIDRLPPETSCLEGPTPIFLQTGTNKRGDLLQELFLNGDGNESCEFGADQVILVPDEKTKEEVTNVSGNRALVLTVLEAKGMEFSDCLIYNFFASSSFGKDWRTLYEIVDAGLPHPRFNPQQHSQLCVELKILYVLLTRARQNLIIYDENSNFGEPMLRHWLKKDLVTQKVLDRSICDIFIAAASTPEVWQQRGAEFLERKQFFNSRTCYQRAGDTFNERLCMTMELEQEADNIASVNNVENANAKTKYIKAAENYLALSDSFKLKAANCYEKAFEFNLAGDQYSSELVVRHEDAARCYEKSSQWRKAMKEYAIMNDVENTVRCGYISQEFMLLLTYLDMFFSAGILSEIELNQAIQSCVRRAAIHYLKVNKKSEMMEFVKRFDPPEDKRQFLQRRNLFDQLLQLEIDEKHFFEAGQIYWEMRNFEKAQDCFEKAGRSVEAVRCILHRVKSTNLDSSFMILSLTAQDLDLLRKGKEMLGSFSSENISEYSLNLEISLLIQFCSGESLDELLEKLHQQVQSQRPVGDDMRLLLTAMRYKLQQVEPQFNENLTAKVIHLNNSAALPSSGRNHSKKRRNKEQAVGSLPESKPLSALEKLASLKKVVDRYRRLLMDDILPPLDLMVKSTPLPVSVPIPASKIMVSTSSPRKNAPVVVVKTTASCHLSSSSFNKLLQCLEFFGLNFVGKVSSALLTPSSQVTGFAITPQNGLTSTFRLPIISKGEVRSTVKEFAQLAGKFFRNEMSKLLNTLVNLVNTAFLEVCPVDTFGSRALRIMQIPLNQRPIVLHNYKQQLELLANSFQFNLMNHGDKMKSLLAVAPTMARIILPSIVTPENIPELQTIRYALTGTRGDVDSEQVMAVVRSILITYLTSAEFAQPGMNLDVIGRALLYAELINDTNSVAGRMRNILDAEYSKRRHQVELQSCALVIGLTQSFLFEVSDEFQPSLEEINWKYGSFLWASYSGILNLKKMAIYKRVCKTVNIFAEGKPEVLIASISKDGIFSPVTFLKLVEKYFVVLLFHLKRFHNVMIPLSLATDNFCRSNKAHAGAVRRYRLKTWERNADANDITRKCLRELEHITQQLLEIIENITIPQFDHWVNLSGDKTLHSPSPRKVESVTSKGNDAAKDLRDSFIGQASVMVLTFIINQKKSYSALQKFCQRLSAAASSVDKNSLLKHLPHYLKSFLTKLNPGDAVSQLESFCKSNHDELVNLSCTNVKTKISLRHLLIEVQNDKVSIVEFPEVASTPRTNATKANVEAQPDDDDVDPPPPEADEDKIDPSLETTSAAPLQCKQTLEDRFQARLQVFNNFLLQRAAEAKNRLAGLSPMDLMLRLVEKEMLLTGLRCRWLPAVQILHSVLTPLQLTVEEILGQLDQLLSPLITKVENEDETDQAVAEAYENMDLVMDAQALLQPILELLLPANYVKVLKNSQSDIINANGGLSSKEGGDSDLKVTKTADVGKVSDGGGMGTQASKWELNEDVARDFAEKLQITVQKALLEFRNSKCPLFS